MDPDSSERFEKVEQERDRYRQLYLDALERCRMLERGLLGQKSERLRADESQLALQLLGSLLDRNDESAEDPETETPPEPKVQRIAEHERRTTTGRQVLPEHLPRIEIELIPDEVQRGLDAFDRIGEDVREVLERRPGSMVAVRICRPKFVRKDRDRNAETEVMLWIGQSGQAWIGCIWPTLDRMHLAHPGSPDLAIRH